MLTVRLIRLSDADNPSVECVSRFSECDLAGSERVEKTLAAGDRAKEAGESRIRRENDALESRAREELRAESEQRAVQIERHCQARVRETGRCVKRRAEMQLAAAGTEAEFSQRPERRRSADSEGRDGAEGQADTELLSVTAAEERRLLPEEQLETELQRRRPRPAAPAPAPIQKDAAEMSYGSRMRSLRDQTGDVIRQEAGADGELQPSGAAPTAEQGSQTAQREWQTEEQGTHTERPCRPHLTPQRSPPECRPARRPNPAPITLRPRADGSREVT